MFLLILKASMPKLCQTYESDNLALTYMLILRKPPYKAHETLAIFLLLMLSNA